MSTDYSKMSDFEINKLVFKNKTALSALSYPHSADKRSCGHKDINNIYHWFDFCNNPADAWPIIDENNITIINDNPSLRFAVSEVAAYFNGSNNIWSAHENGLRAAMITFLKMQESKNAS